MANVNGISSHNEMASRRVLLVSGGVALVLVLATATFFALRGRTAPLWVTRHSTSQTPP